MHKWFTVANIGNRHTLSSLGWSHLHTHYVYPSRFPMQFRKRLKTFQVRWLRHCRRRLRALRTCMLSALYKRSITLLYRITSCFKFTRTGRLCLNATFQSANCSISKTHTTISLQIKSCAKGTGLLTVLLLRTLLQPDG